MVSELWHVWLYLSWALGAVESSFLMLSLWRKAWGRTFAFWPVSAFEMTFCVAWLKSGWRPQPCLSSLVLEKGPGTLVKAERCTAFQVYSSHLSQLNVTESPVLLDTRPVCLSRLQNIYHWGRLPSPIPRDSVSSLVLLLVPSLGSQLFVIVLIFSSLSPPDTFCCPTFLCLRLHYTFWFFHFPHYLLNISDLISFNLSLLSFSAPFLFPFHLMLVLLYLGVLCSSFCGYEVNSLS